MRTHPLFFHPAGCLSLILILALGFTVAPAVRATVIFDNGLINNVNGPSEDIEVISGPGGTSTVLNVMTGADIATNDDDRSISMVQNTVLLFSGGTAQGNVTVEDESVAFILGTADIAGDLTVGGTGELQLGENATIGGEVLIEGNATANFLGGEVDAFVMSDNATAVINGGTSGDSIEIDDDAVLDILDVVAEDDVESAGNSILNIMGGVFEAEVAAVDDSTMNISGGEFLAIFSDGEALIAEGANVSVTGGVFGVAGEDGEGEVLASLGGTINFDGATIAGIDSGEASPAAFRAVLNGEINISNVDFGDLLLQASNNGQVNAQNYTAGQLDVNAASGGSVNLLGSSAEDLDIFTELGGIVNLEGGVFGSIIANLQSEGILNILGHSFTYNGIPVEDMNDVFGTGAFNEETGEIRAVAGDVAGVLADGSSFVLTYQRAAIDNARIFVQQIPEPTALTLALVVCVLFSGCARLGPAVGYEPIPKPSRKGGQASAEAEASPRRFWDRF